jgi:hypothetical protein
MLRVDLSAETGNFAGGGFFMEHAFFCRFVDGGFGCVEPLNGTFRIFSHGHANILDNVFYPSLNRFVPQAPALTLASALQC